MDWGSDNGVPVHESDAASATKGNAGYEGGDARMMSTNKDFDAGGGGTGDGACRNCGASGHFARECTEPRKGSGACFNCGEEGHSKADCPNPRVFKGVCRVCNKEGHAAAECPEKPADVCKNCKKEGHMVTECTENRFIDNSNVEDMTPELAWEALQKADKEKDLDDVRDAVKIYTKATPDTTYDQLERSFRHFGFNTHLIAYEKEMTGSHTLMDLHGKLDRKYQVQYNFTDKPKRGTSKLGWPSSAEENLERLKNAGIPVERRMSKCGNCGELGHIAKSCPQERVEREQTTVKCVNCGESGHRARDCKEPRKDQFACRNCKQSGHVAAECTEPRSAEGVECKHCNEIGHFAKDCPTKPPPGCRNCGQEGHISKDCDQPRNPATVTCRNCDELGHFSKDCPKPRDYSKVKCQNCGEMGHTKVRCKQPLVDVPEASNEGAGDFSTPFDGGSAETTGDWNAGADASGGVEW